MSGLRYVDPDSTTTATVGGVEFVIGFWPPREAERIGACIRRSRKLGEDSPDGHLLAFEANWIAVQYGVRSWSKWDGGPDASKEVSEEDIHGRKHKRLSDKATEALYRSGDGFWDLALAAFRWNNLQEEEKKRSDEPPA